MPISEKDLYIPTLKILYEQNNLTTDQLRIKLFSEFEDILDKDDLKSYKDRSDTAFDQKVRNMKSHYENNYFGRNNYIKFNDEGEWIITEKGKELVEATGNFSDDLNKKKIERLERKNEELERTITYTTRGETGKVAEELFEECYHRDNFNFKVSKSAKLEDKRNKGVGYDYELEDFKIEVKGLLENEGGVLFTEKEWEKANLYRENYFLILFKNIKKHPEIVIVNDPSAKLNPKKREMERTIISWNVSPSQIELFDSFKL
ncbi:MAG: protein NO VEIN domain-containing protein [Bacillota bacterium]